MPHIVLLGDSVFDNAIWVPGDPDVASQLRELIRPAGWNVTLRAVDGSVIDNVANQISRLPREATHLVLSVGGNDLLLSAGNLLGTPVAATTEGFLRLARELPMFESRYRNALETCLKTGLPLVVCTIYNGNLAGQERQCMARLAVAAFDESILRLARERSLRTIDLRFVCTEPEDYANEIEPSAKGGKKIAQAIWRAISSEKGTRPNP